MSLLNPYVLLIAGVSATGKTASLEGIRNQDKWIYISTEAGKQIPFKHKFNEVVITDPLSVLDIFEAAIKKEDIQGIVIDSLDFLLQQFENNIVLTAANKLNAWSEYSKFFRDIMQDKVPRFKRPIIFIAHNQETLDESTMEYKVSVVAKGSVKNTSIEAYFNTIVYSKRIKLKNLNVENDLLKITEDDEDMGVKYVFQTKITATGPDERIRAPKGMWSRNELYIDNNAQAVLDKLTSYYKDN